MGRYRGGKLGSRKLPSYLEFMPSYTRLPNVFAWEDQGQWYYVQDRATAPPEATETRCFNDGTALVLSINKGTSGAFVRDALPWTGIGRQ